MTCMQIGALGLIGAILDELRSRERDDMHANIYGKLHHQRDQVTIPRTG